VSEQRGAGRKPDVKIAIKPKQPKEAKRTYIAAGWREDGKLRLKFDRDIAAIILTDGTRLECADLYVDLYENDGDGVRGGAAQRSTSTPVETGRRAGSAGTSTDDFDDDSIPF
jgi:hypothetical protein